MNYSILRHVAKAFFHAWDYYRCGILFLGLSFAIVNTNCIYIQKCPDSWRMAIDKKEQEEFLPFVRIYENIGESANNKLACLAVLLAPKMQNKTVKDRKEEQLFWRDLTLAKTVELNMQTKKFLSIHAMGNGISRKWIFGGEQGVLKFNNGEIQIYPGARLNSVNAVGVERNVVRLTFAKENIFVNTSSGGGGIVLLVPVAGYESRWARFKAIQPM